MITRNDTTDMNALTRFTQIKLLLHQIAHKPKKCDEAAQSGAHNVEVVDSERRHGCEWVVSPLGP